MRVLVTGRAGQVASSLAERASARPAVELLFAARPEFDLTNEKSIRSAVRAASPDAIVSAAAYTAVDQAEEDVRTAEIVNGLAPGILGEEADRAGIPIIHLSTDYVFDGRSARPYVEDDPVAPINVYGRTKLMGEESLRLATPRHLILRTAWVYSAHGRNFVRTMLSLARERDELRVVADQIGNPTAADDIASAVFAVLDRWREGEYGFGTFHFAGVGATSWAGFARHVLAVSRDAGGPWAEIEEIGTIDWPTPAPRPYWSVLDSTKFSVTFGYSARSWPEASEAVVRTLLAA